VTAIADIFPGAKGDEAAVLAVSAGIAGRTL
jgi:hypothetical protein